MTGERFAVHRNPGASRRAIPFVVMVQSNRFRASARRIVVPLVAAELFRVGDSEVGPKFKVNGIEVVLDPLQMTNVPRDVLGPPVASLVEEEARIVNALGAVLSRAWK